MKDIIEFPVVGTRYTEGGQLSVMRQDIKEGMVLILTHEPDNLFDTNAIKVMALGNTVHIGYVPNKGLSCSNCWSYISQTEPFCSKCGAGWDFVVEGGLATRLIKTGSLEKGLACYVKTVDVTERFSPVQAKLILE